LISVSALRDTAHVRWRQRLGRITAGLYSGVFNLVGIALVLLYALIGAEGPIAFQGGEISQRVRDVLWFALICGVAAFATIEILKRIFALRGVYQLRQTRIWLGQRLPYAREDTPSDAPFGQLLAAMGLGEWRMQSARAGTWVAFLEWLDLTEERRVFNLPTEQLAAQVSAAADVALTAEFTYPAFLGGLIRMDPAHVEKILVSPQSPNRPGSADARVELTQRVRAGVDQLQISLGERWRRLLQGAALWIAGVYGAVLARNQGDRESLYVLSALVLGGLFAWIVRDLAAVLERSRH
jgi:hypothetical protein